EELVATTTEPVVEKKAPKAQAVTKPSVHVVRRGENLTILASRYGVSVSDLKEWNDLASGKIMLGQKLQVSGTGKAVSDNTVVVAVAKKTTPQIKPKYHTVQRGDTLWTISQRYGLTIDKIKQANKIKGNSIKAGMKLLISG
ncbi:MAG: LysM peptidoglycan-binding domain-containing protein, partial [Bacteroidetes bacterium]|nr:LysM peptidoglycan-binding domain-containing protein [Bacteroidota bacterium]